MSDPVLERPLVRQYQRALDAACAITWTENIPLNEAFELAGTGHSTCS